MTLSSFALLLVLAGAACRWTAYRARVAPRRFGFAQRGFWLPPLLAPGEFATADARRLEVVGRVLIDLGVFAMLALRAWQHAAG